MTYPEQDSIDEIEDIKYDLGLSLSHDQEPLTGLHSWLLIILRICNFSTCDSCESFRIRLMWCQISQELECSACRQTCLLCRRGTSKDPVLCTARCELLFQILWKLCFWSRKTTLRWWNKISHLAEFSQHGGHWGGESFSYPTWSAKVKLFLTVLTAR